MPLPDIKKQTIIGLMVTRFAAITAGADYRHTFSKVVEGMPGNAAYDNANTKMINIRETTTTLLEEQESAQTLHDINIEIDIDIIAKGLTQAVLREMEADILKSVGTDLTWSGNAFYTSYVGSQFGKVDQYDRRVSDLTVTINIQFRKTAWGG